MRQNKVLWVALLLLVAQGVCAQQFTLSSSGFKMTYDVTEENDKPIAIIRSFENHTGQIHLVTAGDFRGEIRDGEGYVLIGKHCPSISSDKCGPILKSKEIKKHLEEIKQSQRRKEPSSTDNNVSHKNETPSQLKGQTEPDKKKVETSNRGWNVEQPYTHNERPFSTHDNKNVTEPMVGDDNPNTMENEVDDSDSEQENTFDVVQEESEQEEEENDDEALWRTMVYILAAILLVLMILWLWDKRKRKPISPKPYMSNEGKGKKGAEESFKLVGPTRPLMKDRNIGDVIDNDAYMKIDMSECYDHSSIYQMYVKNECIKDIYKLYAEDLSKGGSRKENGCFVVGRWLYHKEREQFIITLEKVVLPGDDAVFEEYELNFGGKIKLKLHSMLRKLRKDTGLQYDLTCWVHSHPGMGVFFSNSDLQVQKQIIDPDYPHLLTAIVVDILSPEQKLGIFTFKPDAINHVKEPNVENGNVVRTNVDENMPMNSKTDMKRLYSLDEWYRWAVQSEQNQLEMGQTYDILAQSGKLVDNCHGIRLTDGAVVDVRQMRAELVDDTVAYALGGKKANGKDTDFFVEHIYNYRIPDKEVVGYFVKVSHFSIPTVRRVIEKEKDRKEVGFVLVYSTSDDCLTTLHLADGELLTTEGSQTSLPFLLLDQWNKRKR